MPLQDSTNTQTRGPRRDVKDVLGRRSRDRGEGLSTLTPRVNDSSALNRVLRDLIKLEIVIFKKDDQDTRIKHVFLNEKGKKIFSEIFEIQKKRIHNALLNSSSEEVLNFDNVLKKIING